MFEGGYVLKNVGMCLKGICFEECGDVFEGGVCLEECGDVFEGDMF